MRVGEASLRSLPPGNVVRTGLVEHGEASWYGAQFHGRPTTSGERFDMFFAHTAAHRQHPLGTWLLVTHGERELMVRVNDRGPFAHRRIIDLARGPAQTLGLTASGTGYVSLHRLD